MHLDYETLLCTADSHKLTVKEKPLQAHDGRIKGRRIAIRNSIGTSTQKACVLAEELGHFETSSGDILDQSDPLNRKQEQLARLRAYDIMINLDGLIRCYERGCRNLYEMAEYLEVTEEFLKDALQRYREHYGDKTVYKDYLILFEPSLGIMRIK